MGTQHPKLRIGRAGTDRSDFQEPIPDRICLANSVDSQRAEDRTHPSGLSCSKILSATYCYTFFEITDGDVLAFFEHTSLVHPKRFTARCGPHHYVALEGEGDAMVRQLKGKLDAAGVANVLVDHGVSLSLEIGVTKRLTDRK